MGKSWGLANATLIGETVNKWLLDDHSWCTGTLNMWIFGHGRGSNDITSPLN